MKVFIYILNWIGAATLYILGCKLVDFLLKNTTKEKEFTQYFIYIGLGVLLYFPCNWILKQKP